MIGIKAIQQMETDEDADYGIGTQYIRQVLQGTVTGTLGTVVCMSPEQSKILAKGPNFIVSV